METLQRLVKPSDCVIEVGGHIGYLTVFFSQLVGPQGKVVVLEPGTNNLPYLRENIAGLENTLLIEKAASDKNGSAHFLLENLSGQNNTFVDGFEGLRGNISEAHVRVEQRFVVVETVRLDDLIESHQIVPNWVKIDVEGAELSVLIGMRDCLKRHSPSMMIEIAYNKREIFDLLRGDDYQLFSPCLQRIKDHKELGGNTFCLPGTSHPELLAPTG